MLGRIKEFLRNNERNVILVISFTCVFLLGYFTGRIDYANKHQPTITIEKSNSNSNVFTDGLQAQPGIAGESTGIPGATNAGGDCAPGQIKGNISSASKIYHMPGGSFYNRTDAEVCFNTEAEAQAAGFRRSQR